MKRDLLRYCGNQLPPVCTMLFILEHPSYSLAMFADIIAQRIDAQKKTHLPKVTSQIITINILGLA